MSDELIHHGVKDMKWGVWNAETAARYARAKSGKIGKAISNKVVQMAKASSEKRKAKREQKEFDTQTRKRYNLSAKKYEKLRSQTLKSNDPSVVKKGMHLLNDEELAKKIERLEQENRIRRMATDKEQNEANILKARNEARQKTAGYALATLAGKKVIDAATNEIVNPGAKTLFKELNSAVQNNADKKKIQEALLKEKAQQRAAEKAEKKEAAYQERKEAARESSEKTIAKIHAMRGDKEETDELDLRELYKRRGGKKTK